MRQASFHFYGDLSDFFPPARRDQDLPVTFEGHESVKHLIEALGVPHTEVGNIQANGSLIDFDYNVRTGDFIAVYPYLPEELEQQGISNPRFVLDNHLGRLAAYLRLLGFDCLYRNDYQDEALAQDASEQGRILLTRDKRLLMRNMVKYGYWVRSTVPHIQLQDVARRYCLEQVANPFQRCTHCNGLLVAVSKASVLDRLEPLTQQHYEDFRQCQGCQQVYWKGSHYQRTIRLLNQLLPGIQERLGEHPVAGQIVEPDPE